MRKEQIARIEKFGPDCIGKDEINFIEFNGIEDSINPFV